MYTKSIEKYFSTSDTIVGRVYTQQQNKFTTGYDANFSTALNTKVFFDYMFNKGKVQQIRHLLIPTLSYLYRPDFGEEQYGFWKKVQVDTFGTKANYSIFERNIFGGPAIGEQNALAINLSNNIEAKLKQLCSGSNIN